VEIAEIPSHPFFIGVQYHPEFNSWPGNPDPIFTGFIGASIQHQNRNKKHIKA
jgi:CTP synthase